MAQVKDTGGHGLLLKAGPDDGLDEGQFEAYASVFGNKDSYGDIVVPGAFAETLEEWKDSGDVVPLLFGHNMQDPDYNLGHVIDAKEDERGLRTRNQLDLSNPKAAQVYKMLKGRRVRQMSFAYDVLEGGEAQRPLEGAKSADEVEHYYELRKLKLYEVSVVPIGANQETEILAVKALAGLSGTQLTKQQAAALLSAHTALGDLLRQQGQDVKTASGTGTPKATEVASKASQSPSVVRRLAAEIALLELGEVR